MSGSGRKKLPDGPLSRLARCFPPGAALRWAVCGGHAVDLYAGRETRPHKDWDIVVFTEDRAAALETLEGAGFALGWISVGVVPWKQVILPWRKALELGALEDSRPVPPERLREMKFRSFAQCAKLFLPETAEKYLAPLEGTGWQKPVNDACAPEEVIEVFFSGLEGDEVFMYRCPEIRLPWDRAVQIRGGVPCVAPEIMLLRRLLWGWGERSSDVDHLSRCLDREQEAWVRGYLRRVFGDGAPQLKTAVLTDRT